MRNSNFEKYGLLAFPHKAKNSALAKFGHFGRYMAVNKCSKL